MVTCIVCKYKLGSNHELAEHILKDKNKHPENMQKWATRFLADEKTHKNGGTT